MASFKAGQANASADNSSGEYDWHYELNLSRKIMQQYLGQMVMVFGTCANFLNIVVLSQKRMRVTSTNCYLLVLAAYDVLYLVLSGFLNWSVIEFPNVKKQDWYERSTKFVMPLANLISNGAAWLVCAFTLERYIAVCHPMKGRVWCTTRRARWIIIAVCCLSAAVTLPDFFSQIDSILFLIGYYWINSCLFTFIPILALSVFNSLLIHAVVQASRNRKEMQEQQQGTRDCRRSTIRLSDDESRSQLLTNKQERPSGEQQKLTTMLIAVVIVFLVCQIPAALNLLFRAYLNTHRIKLAQGHENLRRIFGGFSNFLVQLNHASNFIVYSMFSTKFRNTFKRVFCSCAPHCKPANATLVIHATCGNESTEFCKRRGSSLMATHRSNNHQVHKEPVCTVAIPCVVSCGTLRSKDACATDDSTNNCSVVDSGQPCRHVTITYSTEI